MTNPKSPAWYGGGLDAIMVPGANLADNGLFYVDGVNGANTNDGLTPGEAFLDITYALSQCTDEHNNYIIVLEYPADGSPPGTETYPIAVDIDRVHLIGAAYPHSEGDKFAFLGATDDNEIFSIQGKWVEIAYFKLSGGTNHAAIEFGDTPVNCKGAAIHHCQFSEKTGTVGNAAHGIWMETNNTLGGNWCYIAYNKFYPQITSYAIRFESNPAYPVIHNNWFIKPGDIAIYVNSGGAYGEITDNSFSLASDTTGLAITFTAAAVGVPWWIDGNRAHYGSTPMTQNPYRDIGVIPGPLENNWGVNWVGAAPTMPVTV
jgi:hypothetical protein